MRISIYISVLLFVTFKDGVHGETGGATFKELVCQQCEAWCRPKGSSALVTTVCKSCPRGPPGVTGAVGPRGPAGMVNITEIEDIIEMKIQEALLRLSGQKGNTGLNETSIPQSTSDSPPSVQEIQTCKEARKENAKSQNETGGLFDIRTPELNLLEVYCDTETDDGGWTVFQRRMDGSVDFFRGWNDYVSGFGDKQREFWLGLEAIHQMTKNEDQELRIDMIRTDGVRFYAKYRSFSIGPAFDYYRLSISGYSGNITSDRMSNHNNMMFSTKDKENDLWSSNNCATYFTGAWWYNKCHHSNLNGIFGGIGEGGIRWYPYNMIFTEMKFRKKE